MSLDWRAHRAHTDTPSLNHMLTLCGSLSPQLVHLSMATGSGMLRLAWIRTDDIQIHLFNTKDEQVLWIWPPPFFLVCGRRYLKAQLLKYWINRSSSVCILLREIERVSTAPEVQGKPLCSRREWGSDAQKHLKGLKSWLTEPWTESFFWQC